MAAIPSDAVSASPPERTASAPEAAASAIADRNVSELTSGVWRRSILGLLLIAALATATFLILHDVLSINRSAGTIINISGRQRMLSQRAALFATRLLASRDEAERRTLRTELDRVTELMLTSHEGLTRGSTTLGLPAEMSAEVKALYFDEPFHLDRQVRQYIAQLRDLSQRAGAAQAGSLSTELATLTAAASGPLLQGLNRAVQQYEAESEAKVARAIRYEQTVYGVTLLALLMEALFIYRPLVARVRRATERLVRQQQFSDQVVNTSQALIVGMDNAGRIALFNQHSQQVTGHTEQEVHGHEFLPTFMPPELASDPAMARLFLGGDTSVRTHVETPLLTKDGRLLTIEWSNAELHDPLTGQTMLHLATGVDITERKQAQQELQQALERTEALGSRLRQEVAHAAVLQRAMLPSPEIDLPGVQGLARLTTSTEVGGDYYDHYAVDGRHAVFLIGDVSGHGVASGTLVSAAKMAIHQLATQGETDPAAMLEHLNTALLSSSHDSMFMTMLCCSLDARTGRLRIANAGHAFPYFWLDAEQGWGMLEVEGLPLGRVREPAYTSIAFDINPGDRLFLYTDGLIEQENAERQPFGHEGLEDLLYHHPAEAADTLLDHVFSALAAHAGRDGFDDDATALCVTHMARVEGAPTLPGRLASARDLLLVDAAAVAEAGGLPAPVARQRVVATHPSGTLLPVLPALCEAGVRRVLPDDQPFLRDLGWQALLDQHQLDGRDDLERWIPAPRDQSLWSFEHSSDKARAMDGLAAWLDTQPDLPEGLRDIVVLMSDELIENGLYGAPVDATGGKLHHKGEVRQVSPQEGLRLELRRDGERLGLSMTDRWGTFTPSIFLRRLALNAGQQGLVAGVGGAGLYLMWRMSDYMQVRVLPQQMTRITLLWSLHQSPDPDRDAGFQFLYHHELGELPGSRIA
ncbi:MAG: hypothetical protein RLZZ592_1339 [Pseudomonadota bacterium]|jgi:PAS domain S-box-containing protein